MSVRISFLQRLVDFLFPRKCAVCGGRLSVTDKVMCMGCNLRLPRTHFHENPKHNEMAKRFWILIPIENAAALFFYTSHTKPTHIILQLKYFGKWSYAQYMGEVMANEFAPYGFFEGIDMIVPVPITKKRERQRGYNQSMHIAVGISRITGIPINAKAIARTSFSQSQTRMEWHERRENVKNAFTLKCSDGIRGKHILIVDDVVTTGATVIACADELLKGGAKAFSVISIGYTKAN